MAFARARSPDYRELYRDLPEGVDDVSRPPVTSKKALMARFDGWATDGAVTLSEVRAFVGDPARIGDKFFGRYTAATTSGTTGTHSIFVLDDRTFAVTSAMAFRQRGRRSSRRAGSRRNGRSINPEEGRRHRCGGVSRGAPCWSASMEGGVKTHFTGSRRHAVLASCGSLSSRRTASRVDRARGLASSRVLLRQGSVRAPDEFVVGHGSRDGPAWLFSGECGNHASIMASMCHGFVRLSGGA